MDCPAVHVEYHYRTGIGEEIPGEPERADPGDAGSLAARVCVFHFDMNGLALIGHERHVVVIVKSWQNGIA